MEIAICKQAHLFFFNKYYKFRVFNTSLLRLFLLLLHLVMSEFHAAEGKGQLKIIWFHFRGIYWCGSVHYKLALVKDICHLPLLKLNPVLPQLLTFDLPWREFRVENEALCAPGKLGNRSLCCSVTKSYPLFVTPWMQHTRLPYPS